MGGQSYPSALHSADPCTSSLKVSTGMPQGGCCASSRTFLFQRWNPPGASSMGGADRAAVQTPEGRCGGDMEGEAEGLVGESPFSVPSCSCSFSQFGKRLQCYRAPPTSPALGTGGWRDQSTRGKFSVWLTVSCSASPSLDECGVGKRHPPSGGQGMPPGQPPSHRGAKLLHVPAVA